MFKNTKKRQRLIRTACILGSLLPSLYASDFIDDHDDGIITGWTKSGTRNWYEQNGVMTPANGSQTGSVLLSDQDVGTDGVLSVDITADTWNGQCGGVVFRWTSPDSYYFVAVQPGNQYSNYIKFCKNSTDPNAGQTIAANFQMNPTFNLRIEMSGASFSFYIDDVFKGSITDTDHPNGKIGYAYTNQWNDYIDFNAIRWQEFSTGQRFLIIVAASLYTDAEIVYAVNQYKADIAAEGWMGTVITVAKTNENNPMHLCSNEQALKDVIGSYHDNGYKGFVFIGSSDDIPMVKWHVLETEDAYDPTDLYYADRGIWVDIGNDGIYESFYADSTPDAEGKHHPDYSRPASESNPFYQADMIYGRIDAGPLCSSKSEEIVLVRSYLNKIHTYRASGSQLTLEEQNRAFAIMDDDWAGKSQAQMLGQAIPDVHVICDLEMSTVNSLVTHLKRGYKFVMQLAHSGADKTGLDDWDNGFKVSRDSSFTLETLDTIDARVNYINLFSCHACDFQEANFGAAYIFKKEHTYNVTGSTGSWGPWLDSDYWKNINEQVPIGCAFIDYFNRVNDSKILREKDLSLPKAIICGDPLLIYGANQNNRPPEIITDLRVKEVQYNKTMFLTFASSDTEGDNITMSMDGSPLPPDAGFSINTLVWTPNAAQIGKEIPFAITARDVTNNNSCTEYFSIYVSHFDDSQFETLSGWQRSGNPVLGREPIGTPFKTETTRFIETSDSWGAISQTIQVEPQKDYLFSLFVANKLTQNNDSACIIIPELGERFPIIQQQSENALRIVNVAFNSGNHAQITITIASGSAQCPTSGRVYVAGSRLAECNLIVGDVTFDGLVAAADALLMERYLTGRVSFSVTQRGIADLNSDNFISVHDRQLVLYYSVGLITQIPVSMTIGDVNNDGAIDILDYGEIYKYLNIGTPLSLIQRIAADVDGDEDVDETDMNLILDYHMNVINEFPYLKK